MDSAEIGVAGDVGVYASLSQAGARPRAAWGGRLRFRPTPRSAAEVVLGAAGVAFVPHVDGLRMLGDPIGAVVPYAVGGAGAWLSERRATPFVDLGLGVDMRLHTVWDVRVDMRFRERVDGVPGVLLTVGSTLHTRGDFDDDHDGVPDDTDPCRDTREDFDGFEDGDGCPDLDNDRDGVNDGDDACPAIEEDRDEFLDGDGCPDPDNDGDGVADTVDACVAVPEDTDGNDDADGCPDPDDDADTIPDATDTCRTVAEDADGFEDSDGCPDPDNDRDGVGDAADLAPDAPETFNFFEDGDGRPDRVPPALQRALQNLGRVTFSRGRLSGPGGALVDGLAAAMETWPEVRVRVSVTLPDAAAAWERGHVVVGRLVGAGIAMERVTLQVEQGREAMDAELIPAP